MGWKGFLREYGALARAQQRAQIAAARLHQRNAAAQDRRAREAVAAERREEREVARKRRELLAEMREAEKLDERARAKNEVARYENYVSNLISIHKECWLPWTWDAVASSAPPPPPVYTPVAEPPAYAALASYAPSVLERMTGQDKIRRSELQFALDAARQHDRTLYQQAVEHHRYEHARWEWLRNVAGGVQAGDPHAYTAVLEHLAPFEDLSDLGSDVAVSVKAPWLLDATLTVRDAEVVPNEIYSLLASGKLASKKMPQPRYWELYQDHVCSCALRVARELFALLPIDVALVHVEGYALDKATGHEALTPLLSVAFSRATVERLNLDEIDPSDSMRNFTHRMDFKKSSGFKPVERLGGTEFAPTSARWKS